MANLPPFGWHLRVHVYTFGTPGVPVTFIKVKELGPNGFPNKFLTFLRLKILTLSYLPEPQ